MRARPRPAIAAVRPRARPGSRQVRRDQLTVEAGLDLQLALGEVEQLRQVAAVGQLGPRLPQLVEEAVRAGLQRRDARARRVLQQPRHQVDGLGAGPGPEDLTQRAVNTAYCGHYQLFY